MPPTPQNTGQLPEAMTLQQLDAVDPEAADRVRAQMGMPPKHAKPARTGKPGRVRVPTQKATAGKEPGRQVAVPDPFAVKPPKPRRRGSSQ